MKVEKIISVSKALETANVSKMSDEGKMKVIRAARFLRQIVNEKEQIEEDLRKREKDDCYDDMMKRVESFRAKYDNKGMNDLPDAAKQEAEELNRYFYEHEQRIQRAMQVELQSEKELSYAKLSEEEMSAFVASNSLSVGALIDIEDALCES